MNGISDNGVIIDKDFFHITTTLVKALKKSIQMHIEVIQITNYQYYPNIHIQTKNLICYNYAFIVLFKRAQFIN